MDDVDNFILDKAQALFDHFGFRKTTMDEISRDCKMSKKTIYEHFYDKKNLFHCLFIREGRKARKEIFSSMEGIEDPLERLLALLTRGIAYFNEDHFITRLLKDDEALFSTIIVSRYNLIMKGELLNAIVSIIKAGQAKGCIREVDPNVAAYTLVKLFQAFSYMKTGGVMDTKELQQHYTQEMTALMYIALKK